MNLSLRHLTPTTSLLLVLAGCATTQPNGIKVPPNQTVARSQQNAPASVVPACAGDAAPLREARSAEIIAAHGTGVDGYRLQDGVWLARAPVLINEDFDFATAMTLDGIGAGIAARNRQEHNKARAEQESARELPQSVLAQLEQQRACGVHRYAIWWGPNKPELMIVTDRFDHTGKLVQTETHSYAPEQIEESKVWLE